MLTLEEISSLEIQAIHENNPDLLTKAILVLEERYQNNPNEVETILRLGHFYWYLIMEDGVYNCHLDIQIMRESLLALYEHAKILLKDNVEFLLSFAYMIGLSMYYFETDMSYEESERLILNMYSHALEIEPSNPFPIFAGRGHGLFMDLNSSLMEQNCKKSILMIYIDKIFENRGHWGEYFEYGIIANLETYLGFISENTLVERDAYVKKIIDEATKTSE